MRRRAGSGYGSTATVSTASRCASRVHHLFAPLSEMQVDAAAAPLIADMGT